MTEPRLRDGRSWRFGAPVVACAFDSRGTLGIALGDGTIRTVSPGAVEPQTIAAHHGAILALATHPDGGFLTGGDDGRLVHSTDAPRELLSLKGRWIENVAASGETGFIACTAGKTAIVVDGTTHTSLPHASTAAGVAFDPKGRRLAVAHYNGASLWWAKSADQQPKTVQWKGSHIAVTWSPDGRFLVTSMQESALHGWRLEDGADMRMTGYPAKVKSWAWDRRGRTLFTSGSTRVIGWSFTGRSGPMGREPVELGPEREAFVQAVAAHPEQNIIAAGTADGAVWLESIGDPGASFLLMDAAKIVAVAFSPDGDHLAIGAEDGYAALIPTG